MAQFASVFVPFALQAASTAWQQYQQYDLYQREQQERAAAAQASAEAARARARGEARTTARAADRQNRLDWAAYDREAEAVGRRTDAELDALNRDFARTELERAEALRRASAGERARFADAGLDPAAGSARAVLLGLGADAARDTRRGRDALRAEAGARREAAAADIADGWRATADQTTARTERTNLDLWNRQVALDSRLHELGVQRRAADRRDLLDLTLSNQRAALGLVDPAGRAIGRGLGLS
ncbi:hypothetical protein [Roseospira goensis]|uniref:Uncharacterized protein n=1 Tax=Roseospira goensis TaxID=391922 RepID=A0A7W6WJK8_9PROT|nr:hypothetical protein [Roseospira goensis]MBB4285120.1 hypothetical protein [Roseospira goensis]